MAEKKAQPSGNKGAGAAAAAIGIGLAGIATVWALTSKAKGAAISLLQIGGFVNETSGDAAGGQGPLNAITGDRIHVIYFLTNEGEPVAATVKAVLWQGTDRQPVGEASQSDIIQNGNVEDYITMDLAGVEPGSYGISVLVLSADESETIAGPVYSGASVIIIKSEEIPPPEESAWGVIQIIINGEEVSVT